MSSSYYILTTLIKVVSVLLAAVFLFFIGSMIGYGLIGEGNPFGVFRPGLWHHVLDFLR